MQNVGRKPATEVEFGLSDFPTDVSVYQPRELEFSNVDKGNCLVKIPKIAPKELVIIDCVYLDMPAADIRSVKCADALGREVSFHSVRSFPNVVNFSLVLLLILGIAFIAQFLVALI